MRKIQLIETGILALALICGYRFFDSFSKPGNDEIVATTPNMAE